MKVFEFGAMLQACRERAGLTQEALAERLHRSRSCISKYERNRKTLDLQTLMQWAEVTNSKEVVVAYLYGLEGIQMIAKLFGIG